MEVAGTSWSGTLFGGKAEAVQLGTVTRVFSSAVGVPGRRRSLKYIVRTASTW